MQPSLHTPPEQPRSQLMRKQLAVIPARPTGMSKLSAASLKAPHCQQRQFPG
jgi:hypothetical protein